MTRIAITGGREYKNRKRVFQILDAAVERLGMTFLMQGSAMGADYLAWIWADRKSFPCGSFAADWSKHGRKAGPIRNQRMVDEGKPDIVIAFPGGAGTDDMISRSRAAGIRVIEIDR